MQADPQTLAEPNAHIKRPARLQPGKPSEDLPYGQSGIRRLSARIRCASDEKARQFNVVARHSLEKKAAQNSDIFTTVSDITAQECRQFFGRPVDVVTPNGFEPNFTPATDEEYDALREKARTKLMTVASAMCGEEVPENAVLVGIGGRYEWKNKGIDVFIDALDRLNHTDFKGRSVHAFIMIPSGHNGPDKQLLANGNVSKLPFLSA